MGGFRDSPRAAYGIACLLAVAAFAVRIVLARYLGDGGFFMPYFLATVASAAMGGFKPGMVTALAGVLLGWAATPSHEFPAGLSAPVRYLVSTTFVCYICETLIRAKERAQKAERQIRENERIYRAIGESIPYGIWICDASGRNTYASESLLRLTGMTQEECSEFGWGRALHPDDAARIIPLWQKCVEERGTWDVEMRYRDVNGAFHPVLARGVPVQNDAGEIVAWAGINLDIARIKRTEAELERQADELKRSNRDLEQFAFVASHDLQEPLRTVNIYTELLLRRMGPDRPADMDLFAGYIRESVNRMERLIRDLLEFSRVIHGEAEREALDTGAAVQDALDSCRSLVEAASAEVTVEPMPCVIAGRAHATQVFHNLLVNALKYRRTDVPLEVRIFAVPDGEFVRFSVRDNGIGFEQQYASKLFKLFARLHGEAYPGNGLGLAICQRIVERYGGRIWAESTPGSGSTFSFTLPRATRVETAQASD